MQTVIKPMEKKNTTFPPSSPSPHPHFSSTNPIISIIHHLSSNCSTSTDSFLIYAYSQLLSADSADILLLLFPSSTL